MPTKPSLNSADLELLKSVFSTKDDLVAMEQRLDSKFATKDDLVAIEQRLDSKFVSKNDLVAMEQRFDSKFATKDDLKQFATKDDLKQFATKDDLKRGLEDLLAEIVELITKQKYDERIVNHESCITKLEERAAFL